METKSFITLENPDHARLEQLGVYHWPIWEKEESDFEWYYDETEMCYIIQGHIIVTPEGGQSMEILPGQLVTFHKGLKCRWQILKAVRKYYDFPAESA